MCRESLWGLGETYLLLGLAFIYAWNCLGLIFGWCHCIFLFCGRPQLLPRLLKLLGLASHTCGWWRRCHNQGPDCEGAASRLAMLWRACSLQATAVLDACLLWPCAPKKGLA